MAKRAKGKKASKGKKGVVRKLVAAEAKIGKALRKVEIAVLRRAKGKGAKARRRKAPKHVVKAKAKVPVRITTKVTNANLLVTYDPNHRGTAEVELARALKEIGEKPQFQATEAEGLFKAKVSNARAVIGKLRDLCKQNPEIFNVTHHYIPIDKWCKSDVAEMQKVIKAAASGINQHEKWKMGLNKRHWEKMEGTQLIIKLTDVIARPNVDLNNPQKIVQVEIIGKEAGIALLTPQDIFDTAKEKGAV